ncbi:MAG: flavodoxin-dependent (E)-4-hydroxy-3-methylbut-2-enyl-diphosphate synthase [Angelakisella sp.]
MSELGRKTREVKIGSVTVGGNHPIAIQSMLNASPSDVEANVRQTKALYQAGCEINRVAIQGKQDIQLIPAIKQASPMPLVADIQFNYRLAVEAAYAGADKVRINPGNIGSLDRVKEVVAACRANGVPIRIGVNSGSLEREILAKHGHPTAEALVESALYNIGQLEQCDFYDYIVAIKSSSVKTTMDAYRMISRERDCPLHLGVTEAGTAHMGLVKSAAALGSLLADGIGDTIRVSLTADPVDEVAAAQDILRSVGLWKKGPTFVSCPTCGRCKVDLLAIAKAVEQALVSCQKPITIAIMGCVVNGPGEAREADIGLAGGNPECILFRKGKEFARVPAEHAVEALLAEVERL